jgi:hypothetical protein
MSDDDKWLPARRKEPENAIIRKRVITVYLDHGSFPSSCSTCSINIASVSLLGVDRDRAGSDMCQ